jgi:hypothetical protein
MAEEEDYSSLPITERATHKVISLHLVSNE